MNFYVRNSMESDIQGPFSMHQINAMLEAGQLQLGSLATGDLGEEISNVRRRDWIKLMHIPGVLGFSPDFENQGSKTGRFLITAVIVAILIIGYLFLKAQEMFNLVG
jgi:hypothetical protein